MQAYVSIFPSNSTSESHISGFIDDIEYYDLGDLVTIELIDDNAELINITGRLAEVLETFNY